MFKKFLSFLALVLVLVSSITIFTACDPVTPPDEPPHVCSFTECNEAYWFLIREANCENPAMYFKSCSCGEKGTETFTVGEPLGHLWGKADSLLDGSATHRRGCLRGCGQAIIEDCEGNEADCQYGSYCNDCSGLISGPDYTNHFVSSDPTYSGISYSGGNGSSHDVICNFCNHVISTENCYGGEALCTSPAYCDACHTQYGTIDESKHWLSESWLPTIFGTHVKHCSRCFTDVIVEDCDFSNATCSERGRCPTCNNNGDFNYDNHFGETEWVIDVYTHYTRWTCCGHGIFDGNNNVAPLHDWVDGHCTTCNYDCLHSGGTATCSTLATCEICNAGYGDYNPNNHTAQGQWVQNKTTHSLRYDCCGNYSTAVEHTWINDGICFDCDYECVHEGGIATCTNRAQCDTCQKYYGERDLNNHNIIDSWSNGNVGFSNQYHYNTCSYGCGEYFNSSACNGGVATCSSPALCDTCSAPHGEIDLNNHNKSETFNSLQGLYLRMF